MVPLPNLSPEQRAAALEKAVEIRRQRAELKERLKSGQETLAEVLERADSDEIIGKLKVSAVLQAMPGVGKIRATQIMERLKIADSRRLRGLGDQQRRALISAFTAAPDRRLSVGVSATPNPVGPAAGGSLPPETPVDRKSWHRPIDYDLSAPVSRVMGEPSLVVVTPSPALLAAIQQHGAPVESGEISVGVYLATNDEAAADAVFSALDRLVEALGYSGPMDVDVRRGSIWRRSKALATQAATSEQLKNRLIKVERALELTYLDTKQAQVDEAEAKAVAGLINSLKDVPSACIIAGSIFLVKFNSSTGPVLLVRTLSALEMTTLERYPEIQTNPQKALEALATAIATRQPSTIPPE